MGRRNAVTANTVYQRKGEWRRCAYAARSMRITHNPRYFILSLSDITVAKTPITIICQVNLFDMTTQLSAAATDPLIGVYCQLETHVNHSKNMIDYIRKTQHCTTVYNLSICFFKIHNSQQLKCKVNLFLCSFMSNLQRWQTELTRTLDLLRVWTLHLQCTLLKVKI